MADQEQVRPASSATSDDGHHTVLLVEDEPMVSKVVGQLLEEAGYTHVSIADHNQIADAIERWRPQCIILDSDPGSAGHQRSWADAAAIRRAYPELPVLMFTADPASMAEAHAGTSARSKAAGYAGVIDKPFLVVEFLATLKHAVGERPTGTPPPDGRGLSTEAISVFPELGGPASTDWGAADFFSIAMHELRTPLTSIDGQAQLAQRFMTSDPVRLADALTGIRAQTKRMNRLIGGILEQARVSIGGLSLDIATFDLGVATAHTIAMHQHDEAPRISFVAPESVRVRGDPDRIAQILGNLLDNALKYSPVESPIAVSLTIVGSEAYVRIEDHGIGIAEAERDRIFAPFYRTSRARTTPGTGLGLHISRRLAEQHLGRLWLEKSGDSGSVFTLALPLAVSAAQATGGTNQSIRDETNP